MRAPGMEQEALTSKRKRAGGGDCDDEPPEEHVNTSCHVQILGTGMDTQDTVPSVLLFFDKKRFIFNAGEGLQRFCTEHKTKLSRIDDVFLTRVCSETAGGFPGLLLTLAGTGEEKSQKTFHLRPYSQLGFDRSAVPKLLTAKEVINELLLEIPEIADASKIISQLWHGSGEVKHTLPPTGDCTTGESWMDKNALMLDRSVRKQQRDTFEQIEVQQDTDMPSCLDNVAREDMEIVLLGTGSSWPSKYRNVSSIFVNLFSRGSFLIDCGEGTLAQLKRWFLLPLVWDERC